jgi:hypothetical protein
MAAIVDNPMQLARRPSMQVLNMGALYFAIVFGAGFLLGPIRILWLEPRVGTRWAELTEAPIMLVVMLLATRWIVRRFRVPRTPSGRLGMGFVALALLLGAEFGLVLSLRGMTIGQYLATRDPVSGTVYYVMLLLFALLPYLYARRGL